MTLFVLGSALLANRRKNQHSWCNATKTNLAGVLTICAIQDPWCLHSGQQPQLAVQSGDEAQHSANACHERRHPLYQPSALTCLL